MQRTEVLIVLDQGTSSSRAIAFDGSGRIVAAHTHAVETLRPQPGHAEMDPAQVLAAVDMVLNRTLEDAAREHLRPVALGLSVQRSSFLFWHDARQESLTPILTWQDTRATAEAAQLGDRADDVTGITGVLPGPYYGGPKFAHLLARDTDLRSAISASAKQIKFIPLESLLIRHLTGGLFIDETIAGRTLLFDIHRRRWSDDLLTLFGVPEHALPELVPSRFDYGHCRWQDLNIPLIISMGDQQAAMTGLGAQAPGEVAINLGTSGSVALHSGDRPRVAPGLLANVAFSTSAGVEYLLEGTINAVGALFAWFAQVWDQPAIASQWPELIANQTDVVMIPGVNGLAAPYWRPDIPTTFVPDLKGHSQPEQLRAGMESIAFLVHDILQSMGAGGKRLDLGEIHVGGGMAQPPLLQFLADLLQHPLHLHQVREATARGVAIRLAQALGWDDLPASPQREKTYEPAITTGQRDNHITRWRQALTKVLDSAPGA
ncbi:FGGY family carbohydrate kinase [Candidatus Neomarinimicrobiota bacterium]